MKKTVSLLLILLLSLTFSAFSEPSLSADGSHVLAVDQNGRVWAWGSNHMGESNPSSDEKRILTPVMIFENAKAAFCGQQFSMAIAEDASLYAWGGVSVLTGDCEADEEFVLLHENVSQADACDSLAACVTKDGKLYAWESGEKTLLSENAVKCAVGLDFIIELDGNGCVYEHAAGEKSLKMNACRDIGASGESRYAITAEGALYAWGANAADGRLGFYSGTENVSEPMRIGVENAASVHAGLSASGSISEEGVLSVWGCVYSYLTFLSGEGEIVASLNDGALITYGSAPLPIYENVADAAFGDAFVSILFENGDVFTWGTNDHGQLGNGMFTETALYENEEDGEYELAVVSASQGVFPSVPINLKTAR